MLVSTCSIVATRVRVIRINGFAFEFVKCRAVALTQGNHANGPNVTVLIIGINITVSFSGKVVVYAI